MHDPPGTAGWMQYSQNGEHRMTVVVEVRASHGYVRLQHPSRASDRTERVDYTVGLIWTVPRFGCGAGSSPAALGSPLGTALPAQGRQQIRQRQGPRAGLRRDPDVQARPNLAPHGADLGRLGGEPGPQGPPPRPDGMRAATYRHQLRLWREAEERLDALANARLGGLLPALAGLLRETAGPAFAEAAQPRAATRPASGRCPG